MIESSNDILNIEHLSLSFYTPHGEIEAVKDVSFTLGRKEILGLVGESGCGKSILCKSIMKLIPPIAKIKSGRITADGTDITDYSERRMSDLRGSFAAYVFQNPMTSLNPTLTIGAQIAEVIRLHGHCAAANAYAENVAADEQADGGESAKSGIPHEGRSTLKSVVHSLSREAVRSRAIELLRTVGIEHAEKRVDMYPHEFSGGMRQRAVIAMALAAEPKLIFADEPTTALDWRIAEQILEVFDRIRRELGTSIVFVSHDLNAVRRIADRIIVMKSGSIVETGSTREIFENPKHAYTKLLLEAASPGYPGQAAMETAGSVSPGRTVREAAGADDICIKQSALNAGSSIALVMDDRADNSSSCGSRASVTDNIADNLISGDGKDALNTNKSRELLLDIRNISYTYHVSESLSVNALKGISMQIRRGEIYGIIGESGSGKSTLAKCLMNILKPDRGSILYKGSDICEENSCKAKRKELQVSRQLIFQDSDSALNPRMSVADIITEPMRINHISPKLRRSFHQEAVRLMQSVGLNADYADKYPSELSGGQRQRAAIARAVSVHPELIIADEALASLDPPVQLKIAELFRQMQSEYGFTLIFISHDMQMVRYLCDRAAVMKHGELAEVIDYKTIKRDA